MNWDYGRKMFRKPKAISSRGFEAGPKTEKSISMMNYKMQTIRSEQSGYERLGELYQATKELYADKLVLDFSNVTFFAANMVSPIGVILARITDRFNSVEFINIPASVEAILRKNQFLTIYRYPSMTDIHDTTMPFLRLQKTDDRTFEDYIQREFRGKDIPRMTEKLSRIFKKKVFEVFQNAVIHSETTLGMFVCGQWFPQLHRLDISIADAGIGIRDTVRTYFKNEKISSVAAIRWALEEHHTTKKGLQPGGLGFKFLHEFINLNKGKIQIASRFGFYQFEKGEKTLAKMATDFPGTAVTIEINTADVASYSLSTEATSGNIF